ncbi:MAG: hypothetical protein JXB34_02140 [Bacteroidales bacterium]|nr:hypothetical protein [Bacteroidales bacterium]
MRTKLLTTALFYFAATNIILAQDEEFKPKGNVYGKVFFNYNMEFAEDEVLSTFELQRAYLGYKYDFSRELSSKVLLDVGKPDITVEDTLKGTTNFQMTAFLKEGSLTYKKGNLTIDGGLIGLLQHKVAEAIWGHRYVYKTFQDVAGMLHTADLGIQAQYKVADMLTLDYVIRNGEGFRNIKNVDNSFRSGGGFTLTPIEGLVFRGYYDFEAKPLMQTSIHHVMGYTNELFSAGGEFSMQLNNKYKESHTLLGYSVFASVNLSKQLQVFGRYDNLSSNKLEGETENWNHGKDNSIIIAGVQFAPVKKINIALDYQGTMPADDSNDTRNLVYLHFEYSF